MTIRAPFAGQIGLRKVNLGQYVNAGDALATLTALDQLYANFTVPQQRLVKSEGAGGAVTIRTDAFPDRVFEAKINAIEPQVAEDTRNVLVQALFDNPDRLLRPGLFVMVNVVLPPQPDAIVVPVDRDPDQRVRARACWWCATTRRSASRSGPGSASASAWWWSRGCRRAITSSPRANSASCPARPCR